MTAHLDAAQIDALAEVANMGSGNAATSLAQMLGRPVDISIPRAAASDVAEAVDAVGPADLEVAAALIPVHGDVAGTMVTILGARDDAPQALALLGVPDGDEDLARSALGELANVLAAGYIRALGDVTGLRLDLGPPTVLQDMLGALVASMLLEVEASGAMAMTLDSRLVVEGVTCAPQMLFVVHDGNAPLLRALGFGDHG